MNEQMWFSPQYCSGKLFTIPSCSPQSSPKQVLDS